MTTETHIILPDELAAMPVDFALPKRGKRELGGSISPAAEESAVEVKRAICGGGDDPKSIRLGSRLFCFDLQLVLWHVLQ